MATSQLVALRDLAKRLHDSGRLEEALNVHDQALSLMPGAAGIRVSAGMLAYELGLHEVSLKHFADAVQLDPQCFPAIDAARRISVAAGLTLKARHYTDLAQKIRPTSQFAVAVALMMPAIAESSEQIRETRQQYEAALDALECAVPSGLLDDVLGTSAFFLAYHGENDLPLQRKAAQVFLKFAQEIRMTAPHCDAPARRLGKIRIGFISRFFYNHSIFSTSYGLIKEMSRDRFEVFALRITPSRQDAATARLRAAADHFVDLDPDLFRVREQIAALELDILFYQDIGMEPMSYALAFARLAPVQCVSFGHPNTTGIPTIDYFVSSELFEPPDAASHYSEQLVSLPDLPTLAYYYKPCAGPLATSREEFGLPCERTLYLCPQTLYKVHPDFDAIIQGILERDARGLILFIEGQFPEFSQTLRDRLRRRLPNLQPRILFIPRQDFSRFLCLLSAVDVVLDTPHFNGMNSSLECFAVGTPVVTLPGRFQRGRHTQAMYRAMDIRDCIATDPADYIDIAVRLGTDAEFAASIRAKILARNDALFEDARVLHEFERFFERALQAVAGERPRCNAGVTSSPYAAEL